VSGWCRSCGLDQRAPSRGCADPPRICPLVLSRLGKLVVINSVVVAVTFGSHISNQANCLWRRVEARNDSAVALLRAFGMRQRCVQQATIVDAPHAVNLPLINTNRPLRRVARERRQNHEHDTGQVSTTAARDRCVRQFWICAGRFQEQACSDVFVNEPVASWQSR
jgi:hypothetical protein